MPDTAALQKLVFTFLFAPDVAVYFTTVNYERARNDGLLFTRKFTFVTNKFAVVSFLCAFLLSQRNNSEFEGENKLQPVILARS